ncbi:MAG: hypothetical protein JF616_17690 [Fibrobacteres bacterium]|nr:hypothetical protein [Fibrobacterota bacterium]
MALGLCLLSAPLAGAAGLPPLTDTERFRLEDRYRVGNYLAMGGMFAEAVAALTHDRALASGFYGASVAMRFTGLPIMASSAQTLCTDGGSGRCANGGYAYFALSAVAEAALAGELYALDYDRRHGAPRSLSHLAGAYAAAGASATAYLVSWYRFRDLRARSGEEERVSVAVRPMPGGGGLTLRFAFGGDR